MATAPKAAHGTGSFELCPAGTQQLVCVDIVDLGLQKVIWNGQEKEQPKVRLKFQSSARMKDGDRYIVTRQFTWSMFKSAGLRKFLETWRGRKFSDEEADAFDFDRLLGANGLGTVVHNQTKRGLFADVDAIAPLMVGMEPIKPEKYVRMQDRPKEDATGATSTPATAPTAQAPAQTAHDPFGDAPAHTDADAARGGYTPPPVDDEDDEDDDQPPF